MIYLLFTVLFAQMMTILLLLFKNPLQQPLAVGLDRLKRGRAPLVVKSVSATVFAVMMYNIHSVMEIRSIPIDALNPIDHISLPYHMLEASLIGFLLFLLVMIDNLHEYIRELSIFSSTIEAAKKQNRACEDSKKKSAYESKSIKEEMSRLRAMITKLECECATKEKEVQSRKANAGALKNRLEGFLVEYDHLLADNKDLRDQLQDTDERLSHSSGNKMVFFSWDQWGL